MKTRRLFIFVEGNDDERFFSRIIRPIVQDRYDSVEIIMYACMKSIKVSRYVKSITEMGHDLILCADIDQERNVRGKKAVLHQRFSPLADDSIIVIIREIESWYLAGLDSRAQKKFGIRSFRTTNQITKEIFNGMIPRYYTSRIVFMGDILAAYSLPVAREKNRSFSYFCGKYDIPADPDQTA